MLFLINIHITFSGVTRQNPDHTTTIRFCSLKNEPSHRETRFLHRPSVSFLKPRDEPSHPEWLDMTVMAVLDLHPPKYGWVMWENLINLYNYIPCGDAFDSAHAWWWFIMLGKPHFLGFDPSPEPMLCNSDSSNCKPSGKPSICGSRSSGSMSSRLYISEFKWSLPVSSWFVNVYEPIQIQQAYLKYIYIPSGNLT